MEDGLAEGEAEPLPANTAGGAWNRNCEGEDGLLREPSNGSCTATLGRPRVKKNEYQTGDIVHIYRVKKTPDPQRRSMDWAGRSGGHRRSIMWVSRGGRCLLCAKEHLRPAESGELGTLFQVQAMQRDLRQLLERIDDEEVDDEEIFHEAVQRTAKPFCGRT